MARSPLRDQVKKAAQAQAGVEGAGAEALAAGRIVVTCRTPGFRRAGIVHPARKEYPLDAFTQEQLDAFEAEPELEVIVFGGTPETDDALAADAGPGRPFIGGQVEA
ncbi:HI1506-related protein [Acidisoma sp. 7E03]